MLAYGTGIWLHLMMRWDPAWLRGSLWNRQHRLAAFHDTGQCCLDVERIETGLYEQQVCTSAKKCLCLIAISLFHLGKAVWSVCRV